MRQLNRWFGAVQPEMQQFIQMQSAAQDLDALLFQLEATTLSPADASQFITVLKKISEAEPEHAERINAAIQRLSRGNARLRKLGAGSKLDRGR